MTTFLTIAMVLFNIFVFVGLVLLACDIMKFLWKKLNG